MLSCKKNLRIKIIPVKLKLCPLNHIPLSPLSPPSPIPQHGFISHILLVDHSLYLAGFNNFSNRCQPNYWGRGMRPQCPLVPTPITHTLTPASIIVSCMDQVCRPSLPAPLHDRPLEVGILLLLLEVNLFVAV